MSFEFLQTIQESRLFSNKKTFNNYSLREISDLTFLYFLVVQILKHELEFQDRIQEYFRHFFLTVEFGKYSASGNDIHQLFYILTNKEIHKNLKHSEKYQELSDKILLNKNQVRLYITNLNNTPSPLPDHRFLLNLEDSLNIKDMSYKAIRRLVEDWPTLNHTQRELAVTRLLQAFRIKARKSELLPWLESLSNKRNLELKNIHNSELDGEVISTQDYFNNKLIHSSAEKNSIGAGMGFNRWKRL